MPVAAIVLVSAPGSMSLDAHGGGSLMVLVAMCRMKLSIRGGGGKVRTGKGEISTRRSGV